MLLVSIINFFAWVNVKMLTYGKLDVSEGIDVNKTSFVVIGLLKILDLNLKRMFVIDVMIY